MQLSDLVGFLVAALALIGSPGPATLSLAAAGAAYGVRASRRYLLGLQCGVVLVIAGVSAGLLTAVLAIPHAAEVLVIVAAAYLVYLAYRIAMAPPVDGAGANARAPGFTAGVVLNLANPKAYAAFAALFSGFDLIPSQPVQSAALKGLICAVIVLLANFGWLCAGSAIRHLFSDRRTNRLINLGFAVLLVASVALALRP